MSKPVSLFALLLCGCLLSSADAAAQRRQSRKTPATAAPAAPPVRNDTPSVVLLSTAAQPRMDTALINPDPQPRRRGFRVRVVPAPAPGRSNQERMYVGDSLQRRPGP